MIPLIFLLGTLSNQLLELKASLPQEKEEIVSTLEVDTWIAKLRQCESGGDDTALNPKDTDGTASKGRFSFKDKTFAYFSKVYGIQTTSIWNGEEQEKILRKMIYDKDVDLSRQFPACTKRIGLPLAVE